MALDFPQGDALLCTVLSEHLWNSELWWLGDSLYRLGIRNWTVLGKMNDVEFHETCAALTMLGIGIGPGHHCEFRSLRTKAQEDVRQSTGKTTNTAAHAVTAQHSEIVYQRLVQKEVSVSQRYLCEIQAVAEGFKATLLANAFIMLTEVSTETTPSMGIAAAGALDIIDQALGTNPNSEERALLASMQDLVTLCCCGAVDPIDKSGFHRRLNFAFGRDISKESLYSRLLNSRWQLFGIREPKKPSDTQSPGRVGKNRGSKNPKHHAPPTDRTDISERTTTPVFKRDQEWFPYETGDQTATLSSIQRSRILASSPGGSAP